MKKLDVKVGQRFGMLTVLKELEPHITPCGTTKRMFECRCDCGNIVRKELAYMKVCESCGCTKPTIGDRTRKYTKSATSSFIYTTWLGMRQRCYDPNAEKYKNYGGRGIRICDDWYNDFSKFYTWSLKNGAKKGLTIDRIDNDGNYEPNNCRWVSLKTQARNKTTTRYITCNGITKPLCVWSEELGIGESTIRARIDKYGYTIPQALGFEKK